jgi:hypothetical protein
MRGANSQQIDALSAFVMSAESERTFSKVRRTTSWEQSAPNAHTIRCSELFEDWQRRGLATSLPTHSTESDSKGGVDSEGGSGLSVT